MQRSVGDTAQGRADAPVGGAHANNLRAANYRASNANDTQFRRNVANPTLTATTSSARNVAAATTGTPVRSQQQAQNSVDMNSSTDVCYTMPMRGQRAQRIEFNPNNNNNLEHELLGNSNNPVLLNLETIPTTTTTNNNNNNNNNKQQEMHKYYHQRISAHQLQRQEYQQQQQCTSVAMATAVAAAAAGVGGTAQVPASSAALATITIHNDAVSIAGEGEYTIVDIEDGEFEDDDDDDYEPVNAQLAAMGNSQNRYYGNQRINMASTSQRVETIAQLSKDEERAVALEQMAYLKATVDQRRQRNKSVVRQPQPQQHQQQQQHPNQMAYQSAMESEIKKDQKQQRILGTAATSLSTLTPTAIATSSINSFVLPATGQRTRIIKRKIIWDPDAQQTAQNSYYCAPQTQLVRNNVRNATQINTVGQQQQLQQQLKQQQQQQFLRRNELGTAGVRGATINAMKNNSSSYVLRTADGGSDSGIEAVNTSGYLHGLDVSAGPSNKKKKFSEVERLMNDEGAANMIHEVQNAQRYRTSTNLILNMQAPNYNINEGHKTINAATRLQQSQQSNNGNGNSNYAHDVRYVKANMDEISADGPSTSANTTLSIKSARRPASNWDYMYGENGGPSMIVRRHSTSSYSSNDSSPGTGAIQEPKEAKEATPVTSTEQIVASEFPSEAHSGAISANAENATKAEAHARSENNRIELRTRAANAAQSRAAIEKPTGLSADLLNIAIKYVSEATESSKSNLKVGNMEKHQTKEKTPDTVTSSVMRPINVIDKNGKKQFREKHETEKKEQAEKGDQQSFRFKTPPIKDVLMMTGSKHRMTMETRARVVAQKKAAAEKAENVTITKETSAPKKIETNNVAAGEKYKKLELSPKNDFAKDMPKDVDCDKAFEEMLDKKWDEHFKGERLKNFRSRIPQNWLNINNDWKEMGGPNAYQCKPKIMLRQYGQIYCIGLNHNISKNIYTKNFTLNATSMNVLAKTITECIEKPDCRTILLCSKGESFCRGIDFHEFIQGNTKEREEMAEQMGMALKNLLITLATCPKPLVAVAKGFNRGFGVSMLALFDFVISTSTARYDTLYAQIGQLPEGLCFWKNTRNINLTLVKKLLWVGEPCSASTCLKLGLVTHSVSLGKHARAAYDISNYMSRIDKKKLHYMKNPIIVENRIAIKENLNAEIDIIIKQWSSLHVLKNILSLIKTKYREL